MSSPLNPQELRSFAHQLEASLEANSAAPNNKEIPLELWIKIASFLDRSDLYTFSQLSRSHHYAALTELNKLELKAALKHLQELTGLNKNIPDKVQLGVMDCYQTTLKVFMHLKWLDKSQIITLSTEIAKKQMLNLHQETLKSIGNKPLFALDVKFNYLDQLTLCTAEMINTIVNQSVNPVEARGEAVTIASQSGHLKIVELLLKNGTIPPAKRGRAVRNAAYCKSVEMTKQLLAHGPISDEDRSWAVSDATYKFHKEIVKILLESGRIFPKMRENVSSRARSKGHYDLSYLISNTYPT